MPKICRLEDIVPNCGVCALVDGEQVAVFRVGSGIVGDLKGELMVASPVYKQHFSLLTGRCLEDESVTVSVYRASVQGEDVMVEKTAADEAAH
jgi:nitrite reductase/ring-hydroxylating ferredoxin subunit